MPKKRPDATEQAGDVPGTKLQERFGRNLRTHREIAGLTQGQLSGLSGVPRTEISQIEAGKINLSLNRMQRLATVIKHDVSSLLAESPPTPSKK